MNTPAHLLIGLAAFGRPDARNTTRAAFAGGLLPDLSLYVLAGVSLFLLQIPPEHVFNTLYFSPSWQTVFAIDNSVLLWGAVLAWGLWQRSAVLIALSGAALLHIALDFPLHHDDGRAHFFPITDWVFQSPLSYWDSAHHAGIIAPIGVVLAAGAALIIWRKFHTWHMRGFALVALAAEIWTARQWVLFF